MNLPKHEIYFDKIDFLSLLRQYQNEDLTSPTPEQTLLIAKAYFIEEFYCEAISMANRLNHKSSPKILFEKHALLFKATYLLDPTNAPQLIKIIDQFQQTSRTFSNKPFHNYHLNVFKEFRAFVALQTPKLFSIMQKIKSNPEQIALIKQKGSQVSSKQKQLAKQHKIQGFPCFLIDKQWRIRQQNFYSDRKNVQKTKDRLLKSIYTPSQPSYPLPITSFAIINHIYEIIPYESKSLAHLNNILFPVQNYEVVSKKHWKYLLSLYGGIPLNRVYGLNTSERSSGVEFDENMVAKLAVSRDGKLQVFQAPSASVWPYTVLPHLLKRYGLGQLKLQRSLSNYSLVGYDKISQIQLQAPLKYVSISTKNIHTLTVQDTNLQTKLLGIFDFEPYQIEQSSSEGLVGLTNDKLMCYMNSTLQCLSNTNSLSTYFMSNRYVEYLNFSKNNILGSRGEITCAFADIVKKIWTLYTRSRKDAEINPSVFKETFAKRFQIFMEDSQQDAHEFLNFLLNCIHDDLNKNFKTAPNRILKNPKDSQNFDDVRKTFFQNYENYNSSIITELFKGYTYSTLKCLTCEAKFYNFDMHLTIPLPIPDSNASIVVSYLNSWSIQSQAIRYSVYLDNIESIEDLIDVVQGKRAKQWKKKTGKDAVESTFYLLSLNKKTYKVENYYETQTKITKLLISSRKSLYFLYEVSKDNANPYVISDRKADIELDSFDDESHHQPTKRKKLTLIEFVYQDERMGYPKLMQADLDQPQEKLMGTIAQTISDQALRMSGAVATEEQKLECIDKIKIDKAKGKPYENVVKVKLSRSLNLSKEKERHEIIGEEKRAQFTLENCFNIYREKDRILEEEGWRCANCKQISECEREEGIYSVGSHLIIVLKRFKDEEKVCTKIEYPLSGLDVSQFMDGHYLKTRSNVKFVYDLYGVIVHRGSLNRGHYYSYCKNSNTGKWYLFDDELVREEDDLGRIVDQNAYILFYKQKSA